MEPNHKHQIDHWIACVHAKILLLLIAQSNEVDVIKHFLLTHLIILNSIWGFHIKMTSMTKVISIEYGYFENIHNLNESHMVCSLSRYVSKLNNIF